jgi:hypothetical protein
MVAQVERWERECTWKKGVGESERKTACEKTRERAAEKIGNDFIEPLLFVVCMSPDRERRSTKEEEGRGIRE